MLSRDFHARGTRKGAAYYCLPVERETGNPEGRCLPSQDWAAKYFYTKEQAIQLLTKRVIKGFRYKNQIYLLDIAPIIED